ncbi:MAG: YhbY family RNA-binding protein [Myxococcales bacterium]|nr:YhbY family RNA-binding protein [Myxococcales bacterium]MDH5307143.1 YhbY family RNA-binding protein [Myxococcales bacterium]MDH5566564.1 YhbY family RNA-binding protein [Myxococcales bacterium]
MESRREQEPLSGADRRYLRRLAHGLHPVVQVGASGVSERLLEAVETALSDHELIKVRIAAERALRKGAAQQIARATGSALAGSIGQLAILYRPATDRERRSIVLPSQRGEGEDGSEAADPAHAALDASAAAHGSPT